MPSLGHDLTLPALSSEPREADPTDKSDRRTLRGLLVTLQNITSPILVWSHQHETKPAVHKAPDEGARADSIFAAACSSRIRSHLPAQTILAPSRRVAERLVRLRPGYESRCSGIFNSFFCAVSG